MSAQGRLPNATGGYSERNEGATRRLAEQMITNADPGLQGLSLLPRRLQQSAETGDNHLFLLSGFEIPTGRELAVTTGSTVVVFDYI